MEMYPIAWAQSSPGRKPLSTWWWRGIPEEEASWEKIEDLIKAAVKFQVLKVVPYDIVEYVLDDNHDSDFLHLVLVSVRNQSTNRQNTHLFRQPEMMGAAVYQDLHVIHLNDLHAGLIETLRHYTVSALVVSSTPGRVQDKDMM